MDQRQIDLDGVGEDLPPNMTEVFGSVPLIVPDEIDEPHEHALGGGCMACGAPLGATTALILSGAGIIGVWCGGACLSDQAVMGWIEEQYDDMRERIEFRGGDKADEPDG